jgi:hypothetical protein
LSDSSAWCPRSVHLGIVLPAPSAKFRLLDECVNDNSGVVHCHEVVKRYGTHVT